MQRLGRRELEWPPNRWIVLVTIVVKRKRDLLLCKKSVTVVTVTAVVTKTGAVSRSDVTHEWRHTRIFRYSHFPS